MEPLIDASITSQEYEKNINVTLKQLWHSHLNNLVFSYLNINSIRNKFVDLDKTVDGNIGILCIADKYSYMQENLMLLERDKLLSKQKDVAAIFNNYVGTITDSLNLFSWPEDTSVLSGNSTVNCIS